MYSTYTYLHIYTQGVNKIDKELEKLVSDSTKYYRGVRLGSFPRLFIEESQGGDQEPVKGGPWDISN